MDGYATLLERVIGNKIGGISVKRLTSKRSWEESKSDLKHEMGYSHIWKRLAAIEDILGDDYDLDRLKELVQADREGRCAVTPCKQGDIVYLITEPQNVKGLDLGDVPDTEYEKKRVFECIVGSITIWDGGSHIQIILLHNGERVAHYIQPKDFKNGVVHFNRENAEAVLQNHKDQEKLPEAYQHQIMSRFCRKD